MSRFVYHVNPEPVIDVIAGIRYEILPGEVFEFENDFHAEVFVERKAQYGLVWVNTRKTKTGLQFDLETAEAEAEAAFEAGEKACVDGYIRTQLEDRIKQNFPALPPSGRVLGIIERRGIDLSTYGIRPIGYDASAQQVDRDRIASLEAANADLQAKLNLLLDQQAKSSGPKVTKPKKVEDEDLVK